MYTKGEWGILRYNKSPDEIVAIVNNLHVARIAIMDEHLPETEANAQLISAAPRMYEGIKDALNILDGKILVVTNEDLDKLKQVKAILNKAKADS